MSVQGGSAALEDLQARLQAWRREGLWRVDPLRFAQLESLLRRTQSQTASVRARLQERLQALLQDYAARIPPARQLVAEQGAPLAAAQPALARSLRALQTTGDKRGLRRLAAGAALRTEPALAELNRHLQQRSPTVRAALPGEVSAGREELASVRAFRRVWGRRASLDRLALARLRQPVHAGPLNSHALVLQSLELMQQLSPDYLRHFLAHVEALQWLEQASQAGSAPAAAAPAKRRRKG